MGITGRVSLCRTTGFSSTQTTGSLFDRGLSYILSTSSILAIYSSSRFLTVAVGTTITGRPPHRSPRAELPHAAPRLLLEFQQFGSHPLADCLTLYRKVPVPVLPADVRESQKIKRFRLAFSSSFPVLIGKSPELDPARLVWVKLQPELPQPFPE